jgi:thymidylate synthase (FAD)
MKVIEPSYEILTPIDGAEIIKIIEKDARTCYKSEEKIGEGTAERMVSMLIKNGHEAMIEMVDLKVKFIHNRGFSHEMVRHRLCSFAQESTRYCNYSADKFGRELTFIKPYWSPIDNFPAGAQWARICANIEDTYFMMLDAGLQPQAARGILPNDLKTEIVVKTNLREWRAIFKLRCASAAHPDMRRVMIPLLMELKDRIPIIFDDLDF